jgi:hypothetical protein
MKNLLLTSILLFLSLSGFCQNQDDLKIEVLKGAKPWTSLKLNNDSDRFQFAVVTDRTGGLRPGVFKEGVQKLNLLQPEFVMSVGDLIPGYTEDVNQLNKEWDEFNGMVQQLEMPFFYVPGNHDITNQVMENLWKEKFGATYYHFVYKDVLFMCLNTEDQKRGAGRGTVSKDQYKYIKKTLEENQEVKWTLIFMHQPLWIQEDTKKWNDVEELLADRKHTVFSGHYHRYTKYERNNGKYFVLATTGGGTSLRGAKLGEFDHVVWITMTEDGPIIANLELGGIWDENVSTEETRAFLNSVWDSQPLKMEPFYTERDFTEGTVKIRVTNDKDVPMEVSIDDKFSWDTKCDLSEAKLIVQPNDVKIVEAVLSPKKQKAIEDYDGVTIKIEAKFVGENTPDMVIPFTAKIAPEKKNLLKEIDFNLNLDGDLREWGELPYHINTENNKDISAAFNIGYDEQYLYIGAQVTDDDIQIDTAMAAWQQDYIAFIVNAHPFTKSVMDRGEGWFKESVFETISPAYNGLPANAFYKDRMPTGAKWECKAMKGGYVLEAAIPLEYLKEEQGGTLETIRFNLALQDRDKGEEKRPRFNWMPNWRGKNNRVGSGMFFLK